MRLLQKFICEIFEPAHNENVVCNKTQCSDEIVTKSTKYFFIKYC